MLTNKQALMLLFIYTKFADNDYRLIKIIDRFDYPINLTENIKILIKNDLVFVSKEGQVREYKSNEKAETYLKRELNKPSLLEYVKLKNERGVYFQITEKLLEQIA